MLGPARTLTLLGLLALAALPGCGKKEASASPTRTVPHLEKDAIVVPRIFQERAGIKVAPVAQRAVRPRIEAVGTVSFNPAHTAAIGTRLRGVVRRVLRVAGDQVKAGDPLAEVESAELGQAQADVLVAQAHVEAAELQANRELWLVEKSLSTAREYEIARAQLKEQRAMLSAARQREAAFGSRQAAKMGVHVLRAPMDGHVVEHAVSTGQSVEPNLTAFRIANLDHLWVELEVFERDIGGLHVGDAAEIVTGNSEKAAPIAAKVAHVGEVIRLDTRTATVRIEIDNHERRVRAGQSVRAVIHATAPAQTSLAVPAGAVSFVDGKPTVFIREGDEQFRPTTVVLGTGDGAYFEVREGLKEGATVVTEGAFALKAELFR